MTCRARLKSTQSDERFQCSSVRCRRRSYGDGLPDRLTTFLNFPMTESCWKKNFRNKLWTSAFNYNGSFLQGMILNVSILACSMSHFYKKQKICRTPKDFLQLFQGKMCSTRIFNSSRQASERLTPLLAKNNLFKADGCSATTAAFSALLTFPHAQAANAKWAPGEHTDCLGLTWKCLLLPAPNTTQRCSNRSNRTKKKAQPQ